MANKDFELTSEQFIERMRSPEASEGEPEISGAIFDQDQARAFLEWACGPEGEALRQQLRESSDE